MSSDTELLKEIRDLLLLLAEPAIAKRDAKMRSTLRTIAGRGTKNATAVLLMDGSRSQSQIAKEAKIDTGQLSKLIKALTKEAMISEVNGNPKLGISIQTTFFEEREVSDD